MHTPILLLIILALIFPASVLGQQKKNESYTDALKTKKATLKFFYASDKAYFFIDKNKNKGGFLADLIDAFSEEMKSSYGINITYDFTEITDEDATNNFKKIKSGDKGTFGMFLMFVNDERKKNYNLSAPLFSMPSYMATHPSLLEITDASEVKNKLEGYNAYVLKGTYYDNLFQKLQKDYQLKLKINYLKEQEYNADRIRQILLEDKKGLQFLSPNQIVTARQGNLNFTIQNLFTLDSYFSIMLSDSNDWSKPFNDFLKKYTKSRAFKESLIKNVGLPVFKLMKV